MEKADLEDIKIAKSLRERAFRHEESFRKASEDHNRRLGMQIDAEEDFIDLWGTVLASSADLNAFSARLDRYDAATVKALQENQVKLDKVSAEIQKILGKAYVHEDGRRMFKTQDGQRVFDETGKQIGRDIILLDQISDHHPYWETYKAKKDQERNLHLERENIFKFQKKLDAARDKVENGNLTNKELDDLGKDIEATMPLSVRKHLPDQNASHTLSDKPELKQPFNLESAKLDMPDLGKLNISGPGHRM